MLGRNPLLKTFFSSKTEERKNIAEIITDTAFELAQHQHGALIIIVKSSILSQVIESGETINATVNKNLLRSIFFPRSPMHDGAVVIRNGVIVAARCSLPMTQINEYEGISLGMRHKAGLGVTETSDVISVIVSEETGSISLAEEGKLVRGLAKDTLKNLLEYSLQTQESQPFSSFFDSLKKTKK